MRSLDKAGVVSKALSSGFTLIELLIAMVIGLVTVVVIGHVMAVSEEQKRSTTTGNDAMVNGALALSAIERDGKGAGYGLTTTMSTLGCEIRMKYAGGATQTFTLSPVSIVDGTSGAPDTIQFLASNKNGVSLPTNITVDHPNTAANIFVSSDVGIAVGDLMLAVPSSPSSSKWCSVFAATGLGGGGGGGGGQGQNQVIHNSGQSDWNQPGGSTIFPPSGYVAGDYLINLGQFLDHTYSISSNNLRLREFNSAAPTVPTDFDLFPQIVQLQAVYGKDTDNDCLVDTWNATQPATNAEWQQIRALRVALVARSQIAEKTNVTLAETDVASGVRCNTASPNQNLVCWRPNPTNSGTGVQIKLDSAADWQRYRYRVFDTTIPIRNLIWLQKSENSACEL